MHTAAEPDASPLRWGVLGAAGIATRKVIPGMRRSRHSVVAAIASRDGTRAAATAAELGIERAYGSYDELLADDSIDVIYIPLPNHLHVPWSIRAADAGRHVLCEKPIGLSAAQARELRSARDRNGVVIGEAFMVRTHPQWIAVQQMVRDGRIGELRLFTCHFSYAKTDPGNIRNRVDYGGGALLDIGCYPVNLARWLFDDEPATVQAAIETDPVLAVDRLVSGTLTFDAGQATFTCATQLAPAQRVTLFGTAGRIEVEVPFNAPPDAACRIHVDGDRGTHVVELLPADQYALQADAFSLAALGRAPVPVSLEDAIANMTVIDALFRAGASDATVRIRTAR
jgi:predicted dehydrogenase